jgi:SpoIID/LytB domain protein
MRRRRLRWVAVTCVASLAWTGGPQWSTPVAAEATFSITGSGWGHGVGMSQHGARGMADQGAGAAAILAHYYTGTAISGVAEAGDLRVLVGIAGSFTLVAAGATTIDGVGTLPAGATATVTRSGGSVVVTGAVGGTVAAPLVVRPNGTPLRLSPPDRGFHRGWLTFGLDSSGGLRAVVNGLSTSAYLRGLGEMPTSWPMEALKAQAIAARSIAVKRAARADRGSSDHDLSALLDGAFIGWDREGGAGADRWIAAVDSTAGQVVTHGGSVVDAYYAASSGGWTESSEYVWVSALPHLRAVADPADLNGANPNASWTVTLSGSALGAKLGLGSVARVAAAGPFGASGRTDRATFTFTDSAGRTASVTGARLRSILGLRSTLFRINGEGGGPIPAGSSGPPGGNLLAAQVHDRRNILVAGRATDPDGAPLVVAFDSFGGRVTMHNVTWRDGDYMGFWPAADGTHTVCTVALDAPTRAAVTLGCRDVVVK